ncbi:MAG: bifunctional 5,10-methylenetetrahydrofolate dehydrogenase/5,10-methenyltetrahydrofolate cyclohydrolase [Candidatus Peribacteria bacterium]|jgi:methylenetetrahydrofolate dehydrogenase (NADP+)/methenyltetrahydrofolate cyclohydrolase|nr:bifunctional 5,10-methylenetetrahydrofolate dehydrogenase/5,10-methenyltetrahydrofolate cyclohydrolase [Candidatus Peribacteria bacterium]
MECKIFGQEAPLLTTKATILTLIAQLNADPQCIGIICQLPLPDDLQQDKDEICAAVHPLKDIDGLGGVINGRNQMGLLSFQPATAKAVFELWDFYQLGEMKGMKIAIIGQSNVVGKPLAIECVLRGANVATFTAVDTKATIAMWTKNADVIISCTGEIHLIDKQFINPNGTQIVIDVGYGFLDGKAVGDVKFDEVEPLVKAITPVPGGVGPLTVASLFSNMFHLQEHKKLITTLWEHLLF